MLRKRFGSTIASLAASLVAPLGVSAVLAIGGLFLTAVPMAAPAAAQGFSVQFGPSPFYGPRPYYPPPPPPPYYARPYGYGPAYGYGPPPRCWFRPTRYWDGYGWVAGRERVCR